jgi:NTE family protein
MMRPIRMVLWAAAAAAWAGPPALASHLDCTPAPLTPVAAMAPLGALKVGLALGSGSSHGLAHIGVIQALEAHGVPVRVVAGTSVGAIVGGLWASGYSGKQIEALSDGSDWEDIGTFAISWQGLFDNGRLRDQMAKLFGQRPIESWPRRFGAVATELASGRKRVLARGDGAAAIQASSAIPVMFTPVVIAGMRLGDGALVEPVPAPSARARGADYVLAVDVAYRPNEGEATGLAGAGFQAMHILINTLAAEQTRAADHVLRLDLHHRFMQCGAASLVASGRAAVEAAWPQIERSLRLAAQRKAAGH